ncbi:hypothetical protein M3204_06475 [Mesobacillus subterraneus]|uniref:hypothetical protein n=1 Tax=Mesobacillus subterraneus TaxID=285983 RepID=UPI00203FE206|nr:hypothetical protein [Mesobacillus subterraneus]MCM3664039.1 hypothetical protein [Mesobacillus subterraneus]MCM3685531.1 hypothetical protein [Mesobacillus subterraneus]
MIKRKILLKVVLFIAVACFVTLYWAYNYKIVSGMYEKLTITTMGKTTVTIENQSQITRIISEINESPRSFSFNNGFTYDYLPHGMLTFENDTEKVQIGFLIKNGNTITKYWEIDTDFKFGTH